MRGRAILTFSITAGWAVCAFGCQSTPVTSRATLESSPISLNAEPRAAEHPPSTAETLARRAERDIEYLREYQTRRPLEPESEAPQTEATATIDPGAGNGNAAQGDSQPGSVPDGESSSPTRLVIWNDGGKPPAARSAQSSPSAMQDELDNESVSSRALARPEESIAAHSSSTDANVAGTSSLALVSPEPASATPATKRLDVLLVDLRRELELARAYSDQPLRELLAMAALSLVDPQAQLNPEAFYDITQEERDLLREMQDFFRGLATKLDGSQDAEEAIVNSVVELQRTLVQEPQLEIPTAALCWRVAGFGNFDTFSPMSFLAHSERQVILYLEVDRFTSELNSKNQWVTELSQQLEIYSDADGIPVWSEPWQRAVDVTTNKRRDFFTTQKITIPHALSVGRYHFKIRVRDEKSGAEAEMSIPFEMVADPKLAARVPEK